MRRRAGIPDDVGALVSEMSDRRTVVTLVNLSATESHTVVIQGGAYGEHQFDEVEWNGKRVPINERDFTVLLKPGAGARLTLTLRRFVNAPTVSFPWGTDFANSRGANDIRLF